MVEENLRRLAVLHDRAEMCGWSRRGCHRSVHGISACPLAQAVRAAAEMGEERMGDEDYHYKGVDMPRAPAARSSLQSAAVHQSQRHRVSEV